MSVTPKANAKAVTRRLTDVNHLCARGERVCAGGEYRKSYHGFPSPVAYVIDSPQSVYCNAMFIDTWNRDKMDINGGSNYLSLPCVTLLPSHMLALRHCACFLKSCCFLHFACSLTLCLTLCSLTAPSLWLISHYASLTLCLTLCLPHYGCSQVNSLRDHYQRIAWLLRMRSTGVVQNPPLSSVSLSCTVSVYLCLALPAYCPVSLSVSLSSFSLFPFLRLLFSIFSASVSLFLCLGIMSVSLSSVSLSVSLSHTLSPYRPDAHSVSFPLSHTLSPFLCLTLYLPIALSHTLSPFLCLGVSLSVSLSSFSKPVCLLSSVSVSP